MPARKSLSRRLRFEVFKRDGFRCVYCGATPVQRPLHADHVIPVKDGGQSRASNLVTACADCNGGKAAIPLSERTLKPKQDQAQKDQSDQIFAYLAREREIEQTKRAYRDELASFWQLIIGPLTQDMYNRLYLIGQDGWTFDSLIDAMEITASKLGSPHQSFDPHRALSQSRYFQGILRNWRESGRASKTS